MSWQMTRRLTKIASKFLNQNDNWMDIIPVLAIRANASSAYSCILLEADMEMTETSRTYCHTSSFSHRT